MQAKVWNDHPTMGYEEKFREELINIPQGKFVEMDFYDAHAFISQYIPIKKTDVGGPTNHKMLRIEVIPDKVAAAVEHRCMACLGLFATENELILHSDKFHTEKAIQTELKPGKELVGLKTK